MTDYVSTLGGIQPVSFDTAILDGKAADGGLYVPTELPAISINQLKKWQQLPYLELAIEILSLFICEKIIPSHALRKITVDSFRNFQNAVVIPHKELGTSDTIIIQELFHGPTLSFKDIAMGFVLNIFDHLLEKKSGTVTIMVATSGDTGPAAAHATFGKSSIDTWLLYPAGLITEEQRRQMTTLNESNIHSIGVHKCRDGSDDLDKIIAYLFADESFRKELNLSSVNSINWGRVLFQMVHYFYGYLQNVECIGEPVDFSVPTGAFGNLCAGSLARMMGLPIDQFIIANNQNACLANAFSTGTLIKQPVKNCPSSALDISLPINFWRHLYFATGQNGKKIQGWMDAFETSGRVKFEKEIHDKFSKGFSSCIVSDENTFQIINEIYETEGYLMDPHAAVSLAAAREINGRTNKKTICLATAHPAKFPDVIRQALPNLPHPLAQATHPTIEREKKIAEHGYHCHFSDMYTFIPSIMRTNKFKFQSIN